MNLNAYIWEIFDIGRANHMDIGVAEDMFLTNLTQKKAAYPGAEGLDYAALGEAWEALSTEEQSAQREAYRQITAVTKAGGHYKALTTARRAGDREQFETIVAQALAVLEAPETEAE